jgi:subtilisin family serine protease
MTHGKYTTRTACGIFLALSIVVALASITPPIAAQRHAVAGPDRAGTWALSTPEHAAGQVVVRLRDDVSASRLLNRQKELQGRPMRPLSQPGVILLQVPVGEEYRWAAELNRHPDVVYAEPNYRVHALEVPDDEEWPQQWALRNISAPQAWDITHCDGTLVAVLDSGAYLAHPDLDEVWWNNAGEQPGNGVDDDGNGKVDDVHGWHFFQDCANDECEPGEDAAIEDDNGHGTHVAGIVAAETGNGIGVAGASWGARVMVVKVLDADGDGYYSDVAASIRYAADNGARVINLSFGGDEPSQLLQDAVDYAHQQGALLVAAAGNDGREVDYPAACSRVVAVAATDRGDSRLSICSHGPEVDIAAPGEGIISTWVEPGLYWFRRGTSMAAPHVSAAAALLWSWEPGLGAIQVEQRLESGADDVNANSYPGWDRYLGWGRLNMYRALTGLPPEPTPSPTPPIYLTRLLLPCVSAAP